MPYVERVGRAAAGRGTEWLQNQCGMLLIYGLGYGEEQDKPLDDFIKGTIDDYADKHSAILATVTEEQVAAREALEANGFVRIMGWMKNTNHSPWRRIALYAYKTVPESHHITTKDAKEHKKEKIKCTCYTTPTDTSQQKRSQGNSTAKGAE